MLRLYQTERKSQVFLRGGYSLHRLDAAVEEPQKAFPLFKASTQSRPEAVVRHADLVH